MSLGHPDDMKIFGLLRRN